MLDRSIRVVAAALGAITCFVGGYGLAIHQRPSPDLAAVAAEDDAAAKSRDVASESPPAESAAPTTARTARILDDVPVIRVRAIRVTATGQTIETN